MSGNRRLFQLILTVALLLGLLGPVSAPTVARAANLHPLVAQLAAESPEQMVAVIVQKAESSDRAEKLVARLGGAVTKDLHIINAFAAEMTASAAQQLAANSSVRWVSPDGQVVSTGKGGGGAEGGIAPASSDPYALNSFIDTLGIRQAWSMGVNGQGITVAVIDSGISLDNDFAKKRGSRVLKQVVVNPGASSARDLYGHGTHVAGIIGGNGADSGGTYSGVAPQVNLIGLRISDDAGRASESDVVAALQWVYDNRINYNIRVVNLSIGSTVEQSYHTSPLSAAAEILWFSKVVVVVSAGNLNFEGGNPINAAPANDPFVITVGAAVAIDPATQLPSFVAPYSASGITLDGFAKPDIISPGAGIISVLSSDSAWATQYPDRVISSEYFRLSGTSMAAPIVSGAAALLLQDEPNLTPDQVKYRLTHTARTIPGWDGSKLKNYSYLDVYAAVTGSTTESANIGQPLNQLLFTGSTPVDFKAVNWNAVNWNAVNWNAVNWNAVSWNAVNWNGVSWEP